MKHIAVKLFLAFLAMTVLTVALLWLIQAGLMRDSALREKIKVLDQAAQDAIRLDLTEYDALSEQLNASLIVIGADGAVQYRSQGLPMMGMMLRQAQTLAHNLSDGLVQYVETPASGRYALLSRSMDGGGSLIVVFSLADVDEAARQLRRQLWIVTLVLVGSSLILALGLARRLARPVRAVTRAARSLAAGDLAVSLPVRSQDEIGQLTAALNDLSTELQKTDQLRKELIANVSHELKAPLSIIRGYAETVRDVTWPDEAKRTAQLNLIAAEADRLSGLVQDMLGLARLQAGVQTSQPVWLPIRPLLAEVIERYAAAAASLPVSVQIAGSDAVILFDRGMLIQVMHNLLSNALNHATPGTAVTLSADPAGDTCRISLTNQGETIAAGDLARIWERFRRAESDHSHRALGTGLGLAIVRSILEQHQAVFGVSSADGQTVFWFDVPALDSKQQAGYS